MKLLLIANSSGGGVASPILSGGDRIAIELVKRLAQLGHDINIMTSASGFLMYKRYLQPNAHVSYYLSNKRITDDFGLSKFIPYSLLSLIDAIKPVFGGKLLNQVNVVYSASDFWPDSIPAWIFKSLSRNSIWVAGFYLFAPRPFSNETPYKGKKVVRGLFYYLSQMLSFAIINRFSDMIWVTNEIDSPRFVKHGKRSLDHVVAVRGGVDVETPKTVPSPQHREFDAVFIGRFHPQKGVLELIDIWNHVCLKKPDAKLVMIGSGDLEPVVKKKMDQLHLGDNISLVGFKDGIDKIRIFKNSKIVVHPAIYDIGGMAAAEAMACGLPGVSFDLMALRNYYPQGMLKTKCFSQEEFAENILKLLQDDALYIQTAREAYDLAIDWDWRKQTDRLLAILDKNIKPKPISSKSRNATQVRMFAKV